MTNHEKFIAKLEKEAKKHEASLGPLASQAKKRPADYLKLSAETQWAIDKSLGILDWDGTWNS